MQTVYIVDDDKAMREATQLALQTAGFPVKSFADGPSFLAHCTQACQGCIILDVAMPGLSGQQVQAALLKRGIRLPIIFLTGHGGVRMAVDAIQSGAMDFLEKPIRAEELLARVRQALELDAELGKQAHNAERIRKQFERLTAREKEVMALVVLGNSNKTIAQQLGLSPRTVEVHRSHVMHKMGVANLAELVSAASFC